MHNYNDGTAGADASMDVSKLHKINLLAIANTHKYLMVILLHITTGKFKEWEMIDHPGPQLHS